MKPTIPSISILLLPALLAGAAGMGRAAAGPQSDGGHVVVQLGNKTISGSMTPAQALARVQRDTPFRLRLPARIPAGTVLKTIVGVTSGKSRAVSIVSISYSDTGMHSFTLLESRIRVSGGAAGGVKSAVRVGRVAGELVEWKTATQHRYDLSWYGNIGYDLRTTDARTHLTKAGFLSIARSL